MFTKRNFSYHPMDWSTLRLRPRSLPPAAEAFRETLEQLYSNGSVVMDYHEALDRSEFDACVAASQRSWNAVPIQLLRNRSILSTPIFEEEETIGINPDWELLGSSDIADCLANALYCGGAYKGLSPDAKLASQMGQAARDSLWSENDDSAHAWSCCEPLTKWFLDLAFNWTFLAVDLSKARVVCLFATDTD